MKQNYFDKYNSRFPFKSSFPRQVVKFFRLVLITIGGYAAVAAMPMFMSMLGPTSMLGQAAHAHHLLPQHPLQCSDNFPCPKELHRRVDFWIQVFKSWGKEVAIFHDPNISERVYSVVDTGAGCSDRVSRKLSKERKRLKTALYNVAAKIESAAELKSSEQIHLAHLFQTPKSKTTAKKIARKIRFASENIRCQSGVKDSFLEGLQRFNRYRYLVDTVLKQYQLPLEIRYLPFVESSYNPAAYSKAGAAGMWQIMPRTARTLGLELNATIDERLDPEASTHAAARYLVKSRNSLTKLAKSIDPNITHHEINPFVITSYNYGLSGMRRAITRIKPDYLSVLKNYKSPKFQVAVKNFYASFLAARHVTLNAQKYFGGIDLDQQIHYQTLVLKHPTSLARIKSILKVTEAQLKPLNLGLTRFVWNGWRMIPAGYQLKLPGHGSQYKTAIARLESMAPETVAPGSGNYIVRKGDTACGIARALQVNCRALINLNRLGKRAIILIGQKLSIPGKLIVVAQAGRTGSDTLVVIKSIPLRFDETYRVKRGDTACKIARRFNVGCRVLIGANQLGRKATIYVGQKLTIPGSMSQSGQIAGLDENNMYIVRKGDYACFIAARLSVNCAALRRLNNLNKKAVIFPGQKLKIPGLEVPDTTQTAQQLAQVDLEIAKATGQAGGQVDDVTTSQTVKYPALSNLLDTLPDLSISITGSSGNPVYRIRVEADETLGHYSDWLGLGSTKAIRKLNQLSYGHTLHLGRVLKLPVTSGDQVTAFERKRIEYHQVLSEALKEHYSLAGIDRYTVQSGDSIWLLSRQSEFPVWLLYRLNPVLKLSSLKTGQEILLPKLQEK
ncbi:LysM peptidoglycan-binding domain-containing protein [Candidatus Spongiihabitans sp.]|uniref:LysM peptidoglycan-binding domain-containing protein n=1 Tax=Candidatus Spongiihabitans sp. TaxID=3101308 RepID=UPI003C7EB0C0